MKKFLAVIGVVVLVWVLSGTMQRRALEPVDAASEASVTVTIPAGSSVKTIANILEDDGVIRSASAFTKLVKQEDMQEKLQAGTYFLMPSMHAQQILEALTTSNNQQMTITIPEGFTVKDIDTLLAEKGITETGDIQECARTCVFSDVEFLPSAGGLAERGGKLEGYLFPDTYFVSVADFTPESFLKRLLTTFESKVIDAHNNDIAASGRTLHQIVTMASLIEEETRKQEERAVVSGILWKRLREGMRLDVDAAVRYILDKPTSTITRSDLKTDSPYNLRNTGDLPPGPIANPSLASIKAALQPQDSAYYYYLHGTDGVIRYARTNDEHNQNRATYLR